MQWAKPGAVKFSDLCLQPNTYTYFEEPPSAAAPSGRAVPNAGRGRRWDLNSFNLIEHSNPASMIFMVQIKFVVPVGVGEVSRVNSLFRSAWDR